MSDLWPETIKQWDREHVWHPFTPMDEYLEGDPVVIERGEGVRLRDVDGNWYYDGVSSVWLNVHGHRSPAIDQAVRDQLDRIAHSTLLGQGNVPSTVLARRLAERSPGALGRVFFSDSGATAVEIALKMAIQYWANRGRPEKNRVLGFTNNYHGDTIGAMGVAPDETYHWPFTHLLPEHPRAPYPYPFRCEEQIEAADGPAEADAPAGGDAPSGVDPPAGGDAPSPAHVSAGAKSDPRRCLERCLAVLDAMLEERADRLAAMIVEPVEGAGGMVVPPEGFLRALRERADVHDLLLIVDEVATGLGRTGPWFACEHEDVVPDVLCLGKGLTGGYAPVAATLVTETIFDAFRGERRRALFHGHSYTGNQLGCAAALANIDLLEDLRPALDERIDLLRERLSEFGDLPFVGDVRQKGFMCGIELVADPHGTSRRRFPPEAQPGYVVSEAARDRGMLIRPIGHTVIFMPPLASEPEELEEMLDILHAAFEAAAPELERRAETRASAG